MKAAAEGLPMNAEYLTMAEIEKKYPNEWVLLDRPAKDRNGDVTGGYVLLHHPDLAEFNSRMMDHRRPAAAALYVAGGPPLSDEIDVISPWTSDSTRG
jgi:hypothetical protein